MSWSISATGHKNAVARIVKEAKAYPDGSPDSQSQIEAAKALILAEIEAIPDDRGVRVEASGHHDSNPNYPHRNVKVKVELVNLLLDE